MSDLSTRLRTTAKWLREMGYQTHNGNVEMEAADEIDQLRARVEELENCLRFVSGQEDE
jgi:hypothetical protein